MTKKEPSKFLEKFVEQQSMGTCIGSGDDLCYVKQCRDYFDKQIPMWNAFEKQVRENECKKWGRKLQKLIGKLYFIKEDLSGHGSTSVRFVRKCVVDSNRKLKSIIEELEKIVGDSK